MKRKLWMYSGLILILLCGCSQEIVDDEIQVTANVTLGGGDIEYYDDSMVDETLVVEGLTMNAYLIDASGEHSFSS